MPPYTQIHFEYTLYILLGGTLLAALIWLAVKSRELVVPFRKSARSKDKLQDEVHEFGGQVSEGRQALPLFLFVLLVLFLIWATAYTIYSADHFIH